MADYQYLRRARLTLIDPQGNSIILVGGNLNQDLARDIQIQFEIDYATTAHPQQCTVKIFNLSENTTSTILGQNQAISPYNTMILEAGFDGQNFGLVFSGTIAYPYKGREDQTDTYLVIEAYDSDAAISLAVVSATINAPYGFQDWVNAFLPTLQKSNVTLGQIVLPSTNFVRGKTIHGSLSNELDKINAAANTCSYFENGKLFIVPVAVPIPNSEIIEYTPDTGLLDMPQSIINFGIKAVVLLNPRLALKTQVKIDQKLIQTSSLPINYTNGSSQLLEPYIATNGLYQIMAIKHKGDTRGNLWDSELLLNAFGGSIMQGDLQIIGAAQFATS